MIVITDKMMGAIMFMLDNRPIMVDRLTPKWGRAKVEESIDRLYDPIEDREIPEVLTDVDKDVLRECVEGSLWVGAYARHGPSAAHLSEARATLRDLSRLLEPMGIEINHIPAE